MKTPFWAEGFFNLRDLEWIIPKIKKIKGAA